jgi:ABC-type multidrug transport system fused ATPase/permease subunit
LILDGIIVIQLAMMSSGHSICIDSVNVVDSVVIIQYLLYFLTVLAFVPKLIYNLPIAYTNSVRIEEILDLEDKMADFLKQYMNENTVMGWLNDPNTFVGTNDNTVYIGW